MKKLSLFITLIFTVYFVFAESLSGTVLDSKTGKSIEFVSVGFVSKNIGSVTNEKGFYEFEVSNLSDQDTLLFSMIGYASKAMKYSDAKAKMQAGKLNISLVPQDLQLAPVEIRAKEAKYATLGHKGSPNITAVGFTSNNLGAEIAMLMKVKGRYNILKKFKLHIAHSDYDTLAFRLNIYDLKNGMPNNNILKKNIIIKTAQKKGEVVLDLTPYNIVLTNDFVIGLEWVKNYGVASKNEKSKYPLGFNAGIFNGKAFYRQISQGKWEDAPVNIGFEVETLYYK